MPNFYDLFNIRRETNLVLSVWATVTVYFTIIGITGIELKSTFMAQASGYVMMIVAGIYSYLLILYPINNINMKQYEFESETEKTTDVRYSTSTTNIPKYWTHYVTESKENWADFMQFLAQE
eukprot:142900_1